MRLRDELQSTLRERARIRWGDLGELMVVVDGRPVFSRRAAGRMPEPGEVARLVQSMR